MVLQYWVVSGFGASLAGTSLGGYQFIVYMASTKGSYTLALTYKQHAGSSK